VTTTHNWILFFTNKGRVYRAKGYELPDAGRDARGQHVANLLAFQPEEHITQVMAIRTYEDKPYLVLATREGLVKKSPLKDYDSPRSGGLIAINLRTDENGRDDELIGAELVSADDDLLLVSRKAQSIRFTATDEALRPMSRATSGVKGMAFREGDELLSMNVIRPGTFVFTATDGGYAKRTSVDEYRLQGRGGFGTKAAKIVEGRGSLVGALVVEETDEIMAITLSGGVIRTRVSGVRETGRDTMGVQLINLGKRDAVVGMARNAEAEEDEAVDGDAETAETADSVEGSTVADAAADSSEAADQA
jgi:DNA gyrase subunit A